MATSKLQALWNHPAGPKTIHFWGPTFKWGISIANIVDFDKPPEKLSYPQQIAVTATGIIWSRYSTVITPKNWNLFSVNVALGGTGLTNFHENFNTTIFPRKRWLLPKNDDENLDRTYERLSCGLSSILGCVYRLKLRLYPVCNSGGKARNKCLCLVDNFIKIMSLLLFKLAYMQPNLINRVLRSFLGTQTALFILMLNLLMWCFTNFCSLKGRTRGVYLLLLIDPTFCALKLVLFVVPM